MNTVNFHSIKSTDVILNNKNLILSIEIIQIQF